VSDTRAGTRYHDDAGTVRSVAEPTLYLFDGSNLFHAGGYADRDELVDQLASFIALRGASGVVVFDGAGAERKIGLLEVRFAPHADDLLERLAAEHRRRESVLVVTSDAAVRGTAGQEVRKTGSRAFLSQLDGADHREEEASRVRDRLDPETRAALERLRRGEQ
jgi:predicted RNA-binding protein with PIN domain